MEGLAFRSAERVQSATNADDFGFELGSSDFAIQTEGGVPVRRGLRLRLRTRSIKAGKQVKAEPAVRAISGYPMPTSPPVARRLREDSSAVSGTVASPKLGSSPSRSAAITSLTPDFKRSTRKRSRSDWRGSPPNEPSTAWTNSQQRAGSRGRVRRPVRSSDSRSRVPGGRSAMVNMLFHES
jgi:hypothetical protein